MSDIEFTLDDINPVRLHERALNEAKKISQNYSFKSSGRTWEDLLRQTRRGHAAEVYLIDILGWKDDEREYKDVIDPDGYPVEIKVTGNKSNVPVMLENFTRYKTHEDWKDWPDHLIIFINPENSSEYSYYGRYQWVNDTWRKQH